MHDVKKNNSTTKKKKMDLGVKQLRPLRRIQAIDIIVNIISIFKIQRFYIVLAIYINHLENHLLCTIMLKI